MTDIKKDFKKFAIDKTNITSSVFDDVSKNLLTPYILEERKLNVAQLDVFSRLLYDRIIYFTGEVSDESCDMINAELLYLDSVDNRDISVYINSGGGSVVAGLSVIDTMNFVNSDVSTTAMGMAASMGAVLLSNGKKGKRFVLPHSRIMIHSVASGFKGHVADVKIEMEQTLRCQKDIYQILANNTERTYEEIEQLCDRDNWFIGEEAVKTLRIADNVIGKKDDN